MLVGIRSTFCRVRLDLRDPHVAPVSSAITPRPVRLGVIFSGLWVDSLAFVGERLLGN
jgi:hypothetical protein